MLMHWFRSFPVVVPVSSACLFGSILSFAQSRFVLSLPLSVPSFSVFSCPFILSLFFTVAPFFFSFLYLLCVVMNVWLSGCPGEDHEVSCPSVCEGSSFQSRGAQVLRAE